MNSIMMTLLLIVTDILHQLISYNSSQLVKDRFNGLSNAGEFDLTYTMRSVGEYMREQKERKELLFLIMELKDWLELN